MSGNQDLAIQKIDKVAANSTATKALYIVVMEDPTIKAKHRLYLALRVDQHAIAAEMIGYEVKDSELIVQVKNAEKYNDAIELVKVSEQESLIIPWHRIIRIRKLQFNVTKST